MKRLGALIIGLSFLVAACGGSTATEAPAETEAPAATEAPVATEAPADTEAPAGTEAPAETDAPAATAAVVPVSLGDFTIVTEATFEAGTVTFDVVNDGDFPHEFGIAKGNAYEELPLTSAGGIDEAALGADNLGKTGLLNGGDAETISFDLEPGNYVFYCNVGANSPASHTNKGQVMSVTVN